MAKQKHPYPQTLYVRYDPADTRGVLDESYGYFLAEADPAAHAETNGKIRIGVYKLVEIADVAAEVTLESVS